MGVTRRVDPDRILAELPAHGRAAVAFDHEGRIDALPARVVAAGTMLQVGLESGSPAEGAARHDTALGRPRPGRLWLGTGRDTVAARNAAADPDVVVLLDAEGADPSEHVLRVRGRATVRPGTPSLRALALLGREYCLAGRRSELAHLRLWRLRMRYYGQSAGTVFEIEPLSAELLRRS